MRIIKLIIILLIAWLSLFSWLKVYKFLDFTLWNLLHGIYASYTMTETWINKIQEVNSSIKNKVKWIIAKVQDEDEQIRIKNHIKLEEAELKQKKKIRKEEIERTKMFIDIIPMIIALLFSWKMFSFIINLIIDENSILLKINKWINKK